MSEPVSSAAIAKWIILSFWALLGGITHALVETRAGRVRSFWDGLALSFVSSFCGMMWGLAAAHQFGNDIYAVAFAAGLGGYLSLEGMAVLYNKFVTKKRI